MSLTSTYLTRKKLLLDNLTNQGVTGYSMEDGLTTLINAVLEISPAPTPSYKHLADAYLVSGKQILSYADVGSGTEVAVVGTQLLDENYDPVSESGVSINWYRYVDGSNDVYLDTTQTDSNGIASYNYTSQGVGDIEVYGKTGSLGSTTYNIHDELLYHNWSKITSTWQSTNFVSGRTIYQLLTQYNEDVELEFKFKDNVPSNFLVGFGETNLTSTAYAKMMYFNYNNNLTLFKDNASVSISNPSKTKDTVFKLKTNNLHSVSAYIDDVLKTTQTTSSSYGLNLRIDDFSSAPMELEYMKVRKLYS